MLLLIFYDLFIRVPQAEFWKLIVTVDRFLWRESSKELDADHYKSMGNRDGKFNAPQ